MSSQWNDPKIKKRKSGANRENRKRQRRPRRVTNAVKDPADLLLLEEALKRFRKVWRRVDESGEKHGIVEKILDRFPEIRISDNVKYCSSGTSEALSSKESFIPGVVIVENFLNSREVEALRDIFSAHHVWKSYSYGSTYIGTKQKLDSSLRRLDFGPVDMRPEGVMGKEDTHTWRIGPLRQQVVDLMVERFKLVYKYQNFICNCAADEKEASKGKKPAELLSMPFWSNGEDLPNTLQMTQIQPWENLGTHWDSRNKWLEGILSIGFGDQPGDVDTRGDRWQLILERGSKNSDGYVRHFVSCNPGTSYIIFGSAQGRTEKCGEKKVMHEACKCCWRHGISSNASQKSTRLSLTLRTYDQHWGTVFK